MFGNIADAVRQIKSDVAHALDAALVVRLCRQLGHRWRERELDPVTTVQGFLLQVLHGNTACSHVPYLLGKKVSAPAQNDRPIRRCEVLFSRGPNGRAAHGAIDFVARSVRGTVKTPATYRVPRGKYS